MHPEKFLRIGPGFRSLFDTSRIICGRVYVTIRCTSVRSSVPSCAAAAAYGGFAAVGPSGVSVSDVVEIVCIFVVFYYTYMSCRLTLSDLC